MGRGNGGGTCITHCGVLRQTCHPQEEDLLGEGTIPAGTSKVANIDNGTNECVYDLKVKMADGREFIQWKVNVCAVSTWTVGDSGNSIR